MQLRYIKSVKEAEEKMAKVAAVAWPVAHRLFIAAARGRLPALPHQPAQLPFAPSTALPAPPRGERAALPRRGAARGPGARLRRPSPPTFARVAVATRAGHRRRPPR